MGGLFSICPAGVSEKVELTIPVVQVTLVWLEISVVVVVENVELHIPVVLVTLVCLEISVKSLQDTLSKIR